MGGVKKKTLAGMEKEQARKEAEEREKERKKEKGKQKAGGAQPHLTFSLKDEEVINSLKGLRVQWSLRVCLGMNWIHAPITNCPLSPDFALASIDSPSFTSPIWFIGLATLCLTRMNLIDPSNGNNATLPDSKSFLLFSSPALIPASNTTCSLSLVITPSIFLTFISIEFVRGARCFISSPLTSPFSDISSLKGTLENEGAGLLISLSL